MYIVPVTFRIDHVCKPGVGFKSCAHYYLIIMGKSDKPVRPDSLPGFTPEKQFRLKYVSIGIDGNHTVTQFPHLILLGIACIFRVDASLRLTLLLKEKDSDALREEGVGVLLLIVNCWIRGVRTSRVTLPESEYMVSTFLAESDGRSFNLEILDHNILLLT